MARHLIVATALLMLFGLATYFAIDASSGSSVAHRMNSIWFTIAATVAMLTLALVALILVSRSRYEQFTYSLFALGLAICLVVTLHLFRANQQARVVRVLEHSFQSLASKGAPFPSSEEVANLYLNQVPSTYSAGYWVSEDRRTFELYYHQASDSFTMVYPEESWSWREYKYQGPE